MAAARLPNRNQSIGYPTCTSNSEGPPGMVGVKGRNGRYCPITWSVGLGVSELVSKSALAWWIASRPARILGSASRVAPIAWSRDIPAGTACTAGNLSGGGAAAVG